METVVRDRVTVARDMVAAAGASVAEFIEKNESGEMSPLTHF